MALMDLSGVLPVVQTPYDDDERIDLESLTREIDWLYEQGVDGLVIAMVSEVLRLSELIEATEGKARVFEGSGGAALVDSYRRGIVGFSDSADLVAQTSQIPAIIGLLAC